MPNELNPSQLVGRISGLAKSLSESPSVAKIEKSKATGLSRKLRVVVDLLHGIADGIDPAKQPSSRIQLFAPTTIGRLLGRELTAVPRLPLDEVGEFYGSGIYALYYRGLFEAYEAISKTDCPIYVGVADPRERHAVTPMEQGRSISQRLIKHRGNIRLANSTLKIGDFEYRYLATESGWQGTAEEFLIWLYKPAWNKEMNVCSGFGKHGDIARTELSSWDVLHGGRAWAQGQSSRRGKTPDSVKAEIQKHYQTLLAEEPEFWSRHFNASWVREHLPKA